LLRKKSNKDEGDQKKPTEINKQFSIQMLEKKRQQQADSQNANEEKDTITS